MKQKIVFLFLTIFLLPACSNQTVRPSTNTEDSFNKNEHIAESETEMSSYQTQHYLQVNDQSFSIQYEKNPTATAFQNLLPLKLTMTDHNDNEKFADLPDVLITNAQQVEQIQAGDVMLYGSQTLVVFYENFSTNYSYTRIGKIDNPTALRKLLRANASAEILWLNEKE